MSDYKPVIRKAERKAYCRCCDKQLQVGEEMTSWYSHRGQGQYIHICLNCSMEIGHQAASFKGITT